MPSSAFKTCARSEEHTSELQPHDNLVCRLLLEKKNRTAGRHRPLCHVDAAARRAALVRRPRQTGCWAHGWRPGGSKGMATFTMLFFFNDTATTEIYPLSLHDALPICLNSSHTIISYAVFCLRDYRVTGVQ